MSEKYTALLVSEYEGLLKRLEALMDRNDKLEKINMNLIMKNAELGNRINELEKDSQEKMEDEFTTVARFEDRAWDSG